MQQKMKKKLSKIMDLNKRTVANLNQKEKKKIKGGVTIFETCLCYTEHKSCSLHLNCCPPPEENIVSNNRLLK